MWRCQWQSPRRGDCDGDGAVSIAELITGVTIALDRAALATCADFDANLDGSLEISELIGAVRSSVEGCRAPDPTPTPTPQEFVAEAADFACLKDWTRVRHFRITNTVGQLDAALAVAHGEQPPPYPVGTIIQLVPGEAMVKRGGGFFPEADDWEFFVLSASNSGTEIVKRRPRRGGQHRRTVFCLPQRSRADGSHLRVRQRLRRAEPS